jgi:hypothetical protein
MRHAAAAWQSGHSGRSIFGKSVTFPLTLKELGGQDLECFGLVFQSWKMPSPR